MTKNKDTRSKAATITTAEPIYKQIERAVTFDTGEPGFESSHRQFSNVCTLLSIKTFLAAVFFLN